MNEDGAESREIQEVESPEFMQGFECGREGWWHVKRG